MPYTVELTSRARKQLRKLPAAAQRRIAPVLNGLADNPIPEGCRKLKGLPKGERRWRLRVGNYRIVYTIEEAVLVVEVLDIGDRKDIYR